MFRKILRIEPISSFIAKNKLKLLNIFSLFLPKLKQWRKSFNGIILSTIAAMLLILAVVGIFYLIVLTLMEM